MLLINPVCIAIQKFNNHSSVKLIRDNITLFDIFQFENVSLDDILKEVTNLNSAKLVHFNSWSEEGCRYMGQGIQEWTK